MVWDGQAVAVMTFDLEKMSAGQRYQVLASLVMPRPIAWVTTCDAEGRVNAAPYSFFNVFGSDPPIVAFAPGNRDRDTPKDTARNIRAGGEFVVHLLDEPLGEAMVATAASLPFGASEVEQGGLETVACERIAVPRLAAAPVAMECLEHSTIEIGRNRLIIGQVHLIHAREGIFNDEGRFQHEKFHPLGRMASPDWYCRTSDQFSISRPD